MTVLRTRYVRELREADRHGRFHAFNPHVPGLTDGTCIDLHSKVMAVDDEWLRIGGVRPHCSPRDLSRCFVSDGLFGGIAVQLWLVISGSEGWVTCSNPDCQKVYAPGRRPKTGQRHFCFQCRVANVPKRISNREYARRNRERVVSTSALPGLNELPGSE